MEKNLPVKKISLKKVASYGVASCMFIVLMGTLAAGFIFYLISYLSDFKDELEDLAVYATSQIGQEYLEETFAMTKELYASIPEEIMEDPFTDEFRGIVKPKLDDSYFEARDILVKCRENTRIMNIYYGFYDTQKERFVLVLDGDRKGYYYIPGQYISNDNGSIETPAKIERIMRSSWYLSFAHTDLNGFVTTDYIPFYDHNGEMIGMIAIDTPIGEFGYKVTLYLLLFVPSLLIMFMIFQFLIARGVEKRIIRPVSALAGAAKAYTERDKINTSEDTSYFSNLNISTGDELEDLKDIMSEMESDLSRTMQEIRWASAEKERDKAEMEVAATLQKEALPSDFPVSDCFSLFASMTPAREVGGDFYDFFMRDEDHLVILIADVSGKGFPAALFMMRGKEKLKSRTLQGGSPSQILEDVNEELAEGNENMMFITIWLGIYEISTGLLTAASAAHEYPFIRNETGVYTKYEDPRGLFCGASQGVSYEDYTLDIPVNGGIFVYTDGVAEAQDASNTFFGLDRIEESLNRKGTNSASEVLSNIKKDIDDFAKDAEQFDDITMLCLIRTK